MTRRSPGNDASSSAGEATAWLAKVFPKSVRHGIWGWYADELALVEPLGFDVTEIDLPGGIWQGFQDRMTLSHWAWARLGS